TVSRSSRAQVAPTASMPSTHASPLQSSLSCPRLKDPDGQRYGRYGSAARSTNVQEAMNYAAVQSIRVQFLCERRLSQCGMGRPIIILDQNMIEGWRAAFGNLRKLALDVRPQHLVGVRRDPIPLRFDGDAPR